MIIANSPRIRFYRFSLPAGIFAMFPIDGWLMVFLHQQPTNYLERDWVIPFTKEGFATYLYFAASVPSLLLTILLFMDQQITSVIVNRPEHKLKVRNIP